MKCGALARLSFAIAVDSKCLTRCLVAAALEISTSRVMRVDVPGCVKEPSRLNKLRSYAERWLRR